MEGGDEDEGAAEGEEEVTRDIGWGYISMLALPAIVKWVLHTIKCLNLAGVDEK